MKIAFASKDGVYVNEHFGWSERFYLYEIVDETFSFIKEIDSSKKVENEIEKLTYKIECINSADILYVQQIGPKASTLVKSYNIFPIQTTQKSEKIEEALQKLIALQKNPPLWLQRVKAKQ